MLMRGLPWAVGRAVSCAVLASVTISSTWAASLPSPQSDGGQAQPCVDASGKTIDVLQQFYNAYYKDERPDKAMRILYEGIRQGCVRYDDQKRVKQMLHAVAEYYVKNPSDDEFGGLVLSMLDEPRMRLIVDEFGDWADHIRIEESHRVPPDSVRVGKYMALHRLALRAEQEWWEPVAVYVENLRSVGTYREPMSFDVTARNRAGRTTRLPGNLVVRVEPADAAKLGDDQRSVTPLVRPAEFTVVVATPDGRLRDRRPVTVPELPPPPPQDSAPGLHKP